MLSSGQGDVDVKMSDSAVYVRLPPELRARVERFQQSQLVRPTLSDTLRALVERGLNAIEKREE